MHRSLSVHLLFAIAVSALVPWLAMAQAQNATVSGTVTAPSGGTVHGATVVLTNTVSSTTATVVTKEDGTFQFPNLIPALYDIRVSIKGFRDVVQRGIVVSVNASSRPVRCAYPAANPARDRKPGLAVASVDTPGATGVPAAF